MCCLYFNEFGKLNCIIRLSNKRNFIRILLGFPTSPKNFLPMMCVNLREKGHHGNGNQKEIPQEDGMF
jgi:hypothetical protein